MPMYNYNETNLYNSSYVLSINTNTTSMCEGPQTGDFAEMCNFTGIPTPLYDSVAKMCTFAVVKVSQTFASISRFCIKCRISVFSSVAKRRCYFL